MEKVNHYFAYGSNMNRLRAGLRIPGALDIGRAELPDWKVVERLYADAVPAKGKTAEGVLYRIGDEELATLDRYEGYPRLYRRETVQVELDGKTVDAMVYIMNPKGIAPPSPYYYDVIRKGYEMNGLDIAVLEQARMDSITKR